MNLPTQRSIQMASPLLKSPSWYLGGIHFLWQVLDSLRERVEREGSQDRSRFTCRSRTYLSNLLYLSYLLYKSVIISISMLAMASWPNWAPGFMLYIPLHTQVCRRKSLADFI